MKGLEPTRDARVDCGQHIQSPLRWFQAHALARVVSTNIEPDLCMFPWRNFGQYGSSTNRSTVSNDTDLGELVPIMKQHGCHHYMHDVLGPTSLVCGKIS